MARSTIVGYPRIGRDRELKRAGEAYWKGTISASGLLEAGASLRRAHWEAQRAAGIDLIPVNDFSLYDQVLDAIALVGAVPPRYQWSGDLVDLDTYFAMARGAQGRGLDVTALEMTKWFDTNYHYLVPEWQPNQQFRLASTKPFDELAEAQALGISAKVVLLGPLSLLLLGKPQAERIDLLGATLDRLLTVYGDVIERLAAGGATWIQLDEPCLVQDRTPAELAALTRAYTTLARHAAGTKLWVQTYFGSVDQAYPVLAALPVTTIGLDLVRGERNLASVAGYGFPQDKFLAVGVVDGRNIWRADLDKVLGSLERIAQIIPSHRLIVSTSSSLQHVPYDARRETTLPDELCQWLAFAEQKLDEVVVLTKGLNLGRSAVAEAVAESAAALAARASSPSVHDAAVQARLAGPLPAPRPAYAERRAVQQERLNLPYLPTTTIGSFPQTGEVRRMRRRFETSEIDAAAYESYVEQAIAETIAVQEKLGLDMLVHGEFERSDMVEYFGEQLSGFAFTRHGWVQSYGSRCVRPPVIFGDVSRPKAMTVRWSAYAQSLSDKTVKGMLTGPVTILNWSFVRDDQPRAETCRQIAFALHDEVVDLTKAGVRAIQIDEPALREGLPLRRADWRDYLDWTVAGFRLAASGAGADTQVHTHMCYSAFDDIIESIGALDADVISIENSRSGGELLRVFERVGYPSEIGPGVYDIHSPRIPSQDEITRMIKATMAVLPPDRLWVNPDCGLKTRSWPEVLPALENMVAAAAALRAERQG